MRCLSETYRPARPLLRGEAMSLVRRTWLPTMPLERFGGALRWYHRSTWRVCKVVRWMLRIRATGMDSIPRNGPAVVIAPHLSYSDSFPCLYSSLPRPPRFLASAFFATAHPVASWLSFLGGVVPVFRDRPDPRAIRRVLRLLSRGELVAFFPEGGRTWTGVPTFPMRSAAKLLARLRVPIYVASIEGAYDHWPRWDNRPRARRVRVRLVGPLELEARPLQTRPGAERWWSGVYQTGAVDVGAVEQAVRAALCQAAAEEMGALDLRRKGRLEALTKLVCFCPECAFPQTVVRESHLACLACGARWAPASGGELQRVGDGHCESLDALFSRMAERLERRAAHAFAIEEAVQVSVEGAPFVRATAQVTPAEFRVATGAQEWRLPLAAAAEADMEGADVLQVRTGSGSLSLRSEAGALRLVLAARALLRLPLSRLSP